MLERKVTLGWEFNASKRFHKRRKLEELQDTTLKRGVRICYAPVSDSKKLLEIGMMLLDSVGLSLVNQPQEISAEIPESNLQRWQGIDLSVVPKHYCPFCNSTEIQQQDFLFEMFGGEGVCQKCRANLSYLGVCQIVAQKRSLT